ncbi:MAG TPA: hypothetical protein VKU01_37140 [Bryobacteraceae bacterium]|nr:hypothetical protein [Bryobacteraceae bacterium]
MLVLLWIGFGVIAGMLASRRFHHTSGAMALDITLSVGGAIAGALAVSSLGFPQAAAFVPGLFGAAIGSIATLVAYRTIFRRA